MGGEVDGVRTGYGRGKAVYSLRSYVSTWEGCAMGLFDDRSKLEGRNFGWGLAAYRDSSISDELEGAGDVDRIALFIDEEGVVNLDGRLNLFVPRDPIDAPEEPTFSKDNLFVSGLRKAIAPFPLHGIVAFPVVVLGTEEVVGTALGTSIALGGREARFPDDTPAGFVPCAGQVLRYGRGEGAREVRVPDLGPRVGPGGTSVTYTAPPGTVYLIRVEEGWREMVPELAGRKLVEFGTPAPSGLEGLV